MLLPAHQFTTFDRQELEDRLACKIDKDPYECFMLEKRTCLSMGNTTKAFDDCMVPLYDDHYPLNSTQFCVDHYNLLEIWLGAMSPEFLEYHK